MFACVFELIHLFVHTCIYIERGACMIYIYITICVYLYTQLRVSTYIHTFIHTYVCLYVYVCMCIWGGIARVLTIQTYHLSKSFMLCRFLSLSLFMRMSACLLTCACKCKSKCMSKWCMCKGKFKCVYQPQGYETFTWKLQLSFVQICCKTCALRDVTSRHGKINA